MNDSKLLTEQGRLFGFRMPGVDPEQVLEIAKKSSYKKEVTKQIQEYQPFDPAEFDKAIQNGLKAGSTDKRTKNSAEKDKNPQQQQKQKAQFFNAIQSNKLNVIDRAFYKSLDRNVVVQSDSEANKSKLYAPNQEEEGQLPSKKNADATGGAKDENQMDIETEGAQPQENCFCKKPWTDGENMICCDGCNVWFHPACVGIGKEELEKIEGENEKWYHNQECKQKSFNSMANNFAAVPNKRRRGGGGKKGSKAARS